MTAEPIRILSFDVGLIHLAFAIVVLSPSDAPSLREGMALRVPGQEGQEGRTLERWGVIDVLEGTDRDKKDKDALTTSLVEALDREFYDPLSSSERYDHVLIENQPARKNPEMKGVQMALHTYFATLRMYVGCVGKIHLVSASRKLKKESAGKKASYRERKALSVELGKKVLTEMGEHDRLKELERAKKKDDLCDALLQALAWADRVPLKG